MGPLTWNAFTSYIDYYCTHVWFVRHLEQGTITVIYWLFEPHWEITAGILAHCGTGICIILPYKCYLTLCIECVHSALKLLFFRLKLACSSLYLILFIIILFTLHCWGVHLSQSYLSIQPIWLVLESGEYSLYDLANWILVIISVPAPLSPPPPPPWCTYSPFDGSLFVLMTHSWWDSLNDKSTAVLSLWI